MQVGEDRAQHRTTTSAEARSRDARRRLAALADLGLQARAEHEVVEVRGGDERRPRAPTFTQSTVWNGERPSLQSWLASSTPVSASDEQRAVAERAPAQAELPHRPAARLALEHADRGDAGEDERDRAADPDRTRRAGGRSRRPPCTQTLERPNAQKLGAASRRREPRSSVALELVERPPAVAVDVLGLEVDRRRDVVPLDAHEVEALVLADEPPSPGQTCSRVQTTGPSSSRVEPDLLEQLAPERRLVALALPRRRRRACPPGVAGDRFSPTGGAGRAAPRRRRARAPPRAAPARATRAAPGTSAAAPRTERPRWPARSTAARRAPSRRASRACGPSSGRSPNDAAVGLLADERDRARPQLAGEPLEPPAVEVAAAEVARARRRPVGGVRHAVAELEQLELLRRLVEPRREARVVEQPPEVVARVREVRRRGRRDAAGVDPAEDAVEVRREDVGNVRGVFGHAADSVADAKSRSPCTSTSSAAPPRDVPARAHRTAAATSSCGRRASCGLHLAPPAASALPRLAQLASSSRYPDEADALTPDARRSTGCSTRPL